MVGASAPSAVHRDLLAQLLADSDPSVARAALDAVRSPHDSELLSAVRSHLPDRRTGAAAVDALARFGDAALATVDDGLRTDGTDRPVLESLVRGLHRHDAEHYGGGFG